MTDDPLAKFEAQLAALSSEAAGLAARLDAAHRALEEAWVAAEYQGKDTAKEQARLRAEIDGLEAGLASKRKAIAAATALRRTASRASREQIREAAAQERLGHRAEMARLATEAHGHLAALLPIARRMVEVGELDHFAHQRALAAEAEGDLGPHASAHVAGLRPYASALSPADWIEARLHDLDEAIDECTTPPGEPTQRQQRLAAELAARDAAQRDADAVTAELLANEGLQRAYRENRISSITLPSPAVDRALRRRR